MTLIPRLAVLLFVCSAGAGCGEGLPEQTGPSEQTPVPQELAERVFPAGELTIIDTVRVDDPAFFPSALQVLHSGEMIAADRGSHQVMRLSAEGEILVRYGTGTGQGPGEHQRIAAVGAFQTGTVWTWDLINRRISLFNADGSFIRTTIPETVVQQGTALSTDLFVGVAVLMPDPFVAFDLNGRVMNRWGWFTDDPAPGALPFVGVVQRREDGAGFIYVPQLVGRLYAYDVDGDLLWHRGSIDRVQIPTVSDDGLTFGEEGPPMQQFPINVTTDDVHTFVIVNNYEEFYIDTYDAASGDYEYSVQIPVDLGCYPLFAGRAELYMRCKTDIVVFRVPER